MGLATANPRGPGESPRCGPGPAAMLRCLGHSLLPSSEALDAVRDRFPSGTSRPAGEPGPGHRTGDDGSYRNGTGQRLSVRGEPAGWHCGSPPDQDRQPSGRCSAPSRSRQRPARAAAWTSGCRCSPRQDLEVFPDADGPAGTRRRAELDAVAAHRRRLAERDGLLEYALLADDLPPLRYEQLADSFQVSVMHESGAKERGGFPGGGEAMAPDAAHWPAGHGQVHGAAPVGGPVGRQPPGSRPDSRPAARSCPAAATERHQMSPWPCSSRRAPRPPLNLSAPRCGVRSARRRAAARQCCCSTVLMNAGTCER